jgi:PAS domain S-box-containing protein
MSPSLAGGPSVRTRLLVLGAATFLIVVGLLTALVIQDVRSHRASATQRLLNLAEAMASNVGSAVGTSRAVVERFSDDAGPVLTDPARCDAWLGRALDALPLFSNLALVDDSGAPVCSYLPGVVGVVDYSDREWLAQALAGESGVSQPLAGRRLPGWIVVLSAPVRNAAGEPTGAVVLALELDRFQELLGSVSLPSGAVVTVATDDLIIVARSRDPDQWVGRRLPSQIDPERPLGSRGVLVEAPSLEGEAMLFANVAVPTAPWKVYAGWSEAEALAPARREALESGAFAVLLLLLTATGLAWVYLPTTSSLRRLVEGTERAFLRREPLSPQGPQEVRSVAQSFNETLAALERTEDEARKLARALRQLVDPVFITDPSGVIEYVNPAFEKLTGYSASEATGARPSILKSGAHGPEVYSELWRTILAGHTYRGRFRNRKKNGDLYSEEKMIAPLRNEAGDITHFISTGKDVSDQEALDERLVQAEKLEAVGQMAGGVAHDFNNLLTAISGYAELLASDLDAGADSEAMGHIQKILDGAQMGGSLTRQLLGFGRRKIAQSEAVSLNAVIERLTEFLRRVIPADVRISLDLDPDAGRAWLDPIRAEQLLLNLALNARDAMPDGGELTLRTGTLPPTRDAPRGSLTLEVSDTGIGIAADHLDRVFEPFFTTKGHGTGLGLATVSEIVHGSGGTVEVRSKPYDGTTFSMRFPLGPDGEPSNAEPEPEVDSGAPVPRRTILLVEDDPQVRALLSGMLRKDGHDVREASDGRDALELAETLDVPIHLVLTDVMMPEMKGPDLVAAMRERHPGLPALFITGYADVSLEPGFSTGPTELLVKPTRPALLRAAVARMALRDDPPPPED